MDLKFFNDYVLETYKLPSGKIKRRFILDSTAIPVTIDMQSETIYNLFIAEVDGLYKSYKKEYLFASNAEIEQMVQTHLILKIEKLYDKSIITATKLIATLRKKYPGKPDNLIYKMAIYYYIDIIVSLSGSINEFLIHQKIDIKQVSLFKNTIVNKLKTKKAFLTELLRLAFKTTLLRIN